MTEKMTLMSVEHQQALKRYLKYCWKEQVTPLPLFNKLEVGSQRNVLSLEDYTVNHGQTKCLSRCLGLFGPNSFTKVYLNNNGMMDTQMAKLFEGLLANQYVDTIEIAYNRIQSSATAALTQFFTTGLKRIKVLRLSGTKAGVEDAVQLFAALSEYKQLVELRLQNFKINKQGAWHLAEAIKSNANLKTLDLSWNETIAPDFAVIMGSIRVNKTLSNVALNNTPIRHS